MFQRYDDDHDGRLNRFEFTQTLNSITKAIRGEKCPKDELETIFYLIDVNGDQTISKSEFYILVQKIIDLMQS